MTIPSTLTLGDCLLLAAHALETAGTCPATPEDLVATTFRQHPALAAMKGYPEYPDSQRCIARLCGDHGLVTRNMLDRVGPRQYRLTGLGRQAVAKLLGQPEPPPLDRTVMLTPDQYAALGRFLGSVANEHYDTGRKHRCTFQDACIFWGLRPGGNAQDRLDDVMAILTDLEIALEHGHAVLHSGREVTAGDVRSLRHLDDWLRTEFAVRLRLLDGRPAPEPKKHARGKGKLPFAAVNGRTS